MHRGLLGAHSSFTRLFLPAARFGALASEAAALLSGRVATRACKRRASAGWPLPLLAGHEGAVLALVADFAGIVRGRQLRNARETLRALDKAEAMGLFEEGSEEVELEEEEEEEADEEDSDEEEADI